MGKTKVIYVTFLHNVACQKLLKSANISRSYSKHNTGTIFLRYGVVLLLSAVATDCVVFAGVFFYVIAR